GPRALQPLPLGGPEDAEEGVRPLYHAEPRRALLGALRTRLGCGLDQVERPREQIAEGLVVRVGIDVVAQGDEEAHSAMNDRLAQLFRERLLQRLDVEQDDHVLAVERCAGRGIRIQRPRSDAPPGPRWSEGRLDEEGLVAGAQRRGRSIDDQRLHVAGNVEDEILPVVLVQALGLVAGDLYPSSDDAG